MAFPQGADSLGGTYPTFPSLLAGNYTIYDSIVGSYERMVSGAPDGAIYLLGDSNLNFCASPVVHPYSVNMGISGVDYRMLMDKLKKLHLANPSGGLHAAGALVINCGVNTIGKEIAAGKTEAQMLGNADVMLQRMTNWFTGKGVIIKVAPIQPGAFANVTNARIAALNDLIVNRFGSKTNWAVVDVNSTLAPSGTLLSEYTPDGGHLNGHAWNTVIGPAVATALAGLGV